MPNKQDQSKPHGKATLCSKEVFGLKSLEQLIEMAAENLPEDWEIRIEVQHEYGAVIVTRPDGTEVYVSDGENSIREQFRDAGLLIRDEIAADRLLRPNGKADGQPN